MKTDFLVVGSGLFGAVMAERIATKLKKTVLVIEKRDHIGGNCFSEVDPETGIEFHKYGSHIFHTSNKQVWDYVSQFAEFNNYHHQGLTTYKNRVYQMPINLETINSFYGKNLNPKEAELFVQKEIKKEFYPAPKNLEEKAISLIGRPLYEAFIKGYTVKQWDRDPKKLPIGIITRLPVRYNYNEDYFNNCNWQGIPKDGYTHLFKTILDHKRIRVQTGSDFFKIKNQIKVKDFTVYTGPIDRYFKYSKGKLDWRTIKLEKEIFDGPDYQGAAIMNFAEEKIPYTRIHEPRHLHPERGYLSKKSIVFKEFSLVDSENPYYPIKDEKNSNILIEYRRLACRQKYLIIGGRLGDFAYYDMDMSIGAALKKFETTFLPIP